MAVVTLALGYSSEVTIDTANAGDFVASAELGGWVSGSLTLTRTNPDSTNIDTGGYQGREYGIKGATLSLEVLNDEVGDSAVQDVLLDDYTGGVKRWMRIRPRVGSGFFEYEFKAVFDSVTYTMEQGGIVRFSLAASTDGTITMAAQS